MKVTRSLPRGPLCLGLALLCLCSSAACKPTSSRQAAERDPMVAMPSEGQTLGYELQAQQAAGPAPEVHYVTGPQQPQQEVLIEYQPAAGEQQQQQLVYRQQEAPYQLVHVPVQVEASGEPARAEYPGEIVYVGQAGAEQNESSLAQAAGSLQQNDGLSATILTEVPLRDMPHEVLSKLRREYGVKVVATRERPGANLVIACDEHSASHASAVCNKQQAHQVHYQTPEQHFYQPHAQPQQPTFEYAPVERLASLRPRPRRPHQIRTQLIHIEHEMAVPSGHAAQSHAAGVPHELASSRQQEPSVQVFSHRGLANEEVVAPEQPQAYHTAGLNQEQAQAAGEEPGSSLGQPQSELYGARTATTPAAAGEQPGELSASHEALAAPGAEQTGAEQAAGHEQPAELPQTAGHELTGDQNSGFDEQAPRGSEPSQAPATYGQ